MIKWRQILLTTFSLLAFTANSILCRLALRDTKINPANFTTIRLCSGALVLIFLALYHHARSGNDSATSHRGGDWLSAFSLLVYAFGFSFAYTTLAAGMGALLLFAAVQATMIFAGILQGEHLRARQWLGLLAAFWGVITLLLPSSSKPPLGASLLMLSAGIGWGVYSIRGRRATHPISVSAGNFLRASLGALILSGLLFPWPPLDSKGVLFAVLSGAVASGFGYAAWYASLRYITSVKAAALQLLVPVFTSIAGILLLHEHVSMLLLLASTAVLGGVALVLQDRKPPQKSNNNSV